MLYLKQLINSKLIRTMKVSTDKNLADILTKHVGADTCSYLRKRIGLVDEDQATIDAIEEKENDIYPKNKNVMAKGGNAMKMIAMIVLSECVSVDALKTAKDEPEFEMWKWFLLNWVAVIMTVMIILIVVLLSLIHI